MEVSPDDHGPTVPLSATHLPEAELSESQLLALVQRSGAANLEDFGQRTLVRFLQRARGAGIPAQDCEDVAQEAWLAALSQLRRGVFRGESSLETWLRRIIGGKIADYWRARGLRDVALTQATDGEWVTEHDPCQRLNWTVAGDQSLVANVHEVLRKLPRLHRVILLLNRTAGYTIEEISQSSGLTPGQVSARLYAAEEMFRRLLRGESAGEPPPRQLRAPGKRQPKIKEK